MIHHVIIKNDEPPKQVTVSQIVKSLGGSCYMAKNILKCHYTTLMRKVDHNHLSEDDLERIEIYLSKQSNSIDHIGECIKMSEFGVMPDGRGR